jgi:uncharacterized membrane protein YkvA (DUF1232 family)
MLRLLKLWRLVGKDLHVLKFALAHPRRPSWLLPALALLGLFALEPMNFALPGMGVVDDFVLLPMLFHLIMKFLPAEVRAGARPSR